LPMSHARPVNTLAISSDNGRLVSGSDDRTVRVWSLRHNAVTSASASQPLVVRSESRVTAVAFSSDGTTLAVGHQDHTVRLRDGHNPRHRISKEPNYPEAITSIVFAADNRTVISSTHEAVVYWNAQNHEAPRALKGHRKWVNCVDWSADGRFFASGDDEGLTIVWDAHKVAYAKTLRGNSKVTAVAFSPDGRVIAIGSENGEVRLWDVVEARCLWTFRADERKVSVITFLRDGTGSTLAVGGGKDGLIRILDTATGTVLRSLVGHGDDVLCLVYSPNLRWLASGGADCCVRLWLADDGALRACFPHEDPIKALWFSASSSSVHVADDGGPTHVPTVNILEIANPTG
ncbi:MAG TPA: WD40 repeat domain-containing protein, partial [Nitrospiria bacterium]|nr:WD40 repeat domain-containing protein [Nitrospiria bacterium]